MLELGAPFYPLHFPPLHPQGFFSSRLWKSSHPPQSRQSYRSAPSGTLSFPWGLEREEKQTTLSNPNLDHIIEPVVKRWL